MEKVETEIKLDLDRIRNYKLFIACPMYGGQGSGMFMKSCLDLCSLLHAQRIEHKFSFLFNESLIPRARNYLADEFVRSGYTHMLFIDSDIDFKAIDIIALLHFDKDIIGAPYPKKSIKWESIIDSVKKHPNITPNDLNQLTGDFVFNPVPGTKEFSIQKPLEVLEIGTGYMLIKREVFDKFATEYPHLRYKPDHVGQENFDGKRYIHAFFDTVIDPSSERYLSEDYFFCQYWRNIGGQVWLCPWMTTSHIGTYSFSGNLQATAQFLGKI
jgi:hypothetical protein